MPDGNSLQGRTILILQRIWMIAHGLAVAFEKKGAKVVATRDPHPDLASIPNLAAAVLDNHSCDLCRQLRVRGIPFVLYTARIDHDCGAVTIIQKPTLVTEVVAAVEGLLTCKAPGTT
jgi:DNA-binding response OmpR family regulator